MNVIELLEAGKEAIPEWVMQEDAAFKLLLKQLDMMLRMKPTYDKIDREWTIGGKIDLGDDNLLPSGKRIEYARTEIAKHLLVLAKEGRIPRVHSGKNPNSWKKSPKYIHGGDSFQAVKSVMAAYLSPQLEIQHSGRTVLPNHVYFGYSLEAPNKQPKTTVPIERKVTRIRKGDTTA